MDTIETAIAASCAARHFARKDEDDYVDPEVRRDAREGSLKLLMAQLAAGQFPTAGGQ